jgi:hypothetical protein
MVKFKTPTVYLPEDISTLQAMVLQLLSSGNNIRSYKAGSYSEVIFAPHAQQYKGT